MRSKQKAQGLAKRQVRSLRCRLDVPIRLYVRTFWYTSSQSGTSLFSPLVRFFPTSPPGSMGLLGAVGSMPLWETLCFIVAGSMVTGQNVSNFSGIFEN